MEKINLADYDSRAVRAAAKRLRSCAQALSDGTQGGLQAIRRELPSRLDGEAGIALREKLNDLGADLVTVMGGINGLVRALNNYADDLERASARLSERMEE